VKKPFAVFDIDGTLIRWQLYHATADALVRLGYISKDKYQSIKDARMAWKRREGEEAFKTYESQLVSLYEKVLRNLTPGQYDEAAQAVFDEYKDQVYRYTRTLIADLKTKRYLLFAISGSQTEIVGKIAHYYGFDDYIGTVYERAEGKFTGKRKLHAGSKHVILDELVKKHGATYEGSVAVGDSESDITMLEAVDQPIAFNPSKKLLQYVQKKGWKIVVERKNTIYELIKKDNKYTLVNN
jgi:HAD superfamily hydrolase (TIGR01490 family)